MKSFFPSFLGVTTSALALMTFAQPVLAAPNFSVSGAFPQATLDQRYTASIRLNRSGDSRWFIVSGALPRGLTLARTSQTMTYADAEISGTPTESGTFSFRVFVTTPSATYIDDFTLTVFNPRVEVNPYWVVRGRVGLAYLQPLTLNGTVNEPVTWSLTSGTLPPGIALRGATGELVGTPTSEGTFEFTVGARDAVGRTGSRGYVITVEPTSAPAPASTVRITTLANPVSGQVGSVYPAQIFRASGGSGSYTWLMSGSIPPGLSIDRTSGILSGTPTVAGTHVFFLKASDASAPDNNQQIGYELIVHPEPTLPTTFVRPTPIPSPTLTPTPTPSPSTPPAPTTPLPSPAPSAPAPTLAPTPSPSPTPIPPVAPLTPTPSTPAPTPTPSVSAVDEKEILIRDLEARERELREKQVASGNGAVTATVSLTPRQQALWRTYERRWSTVRSRIHTSVARLSTSLEEEPYAQLLDEVDASGLAASIEELNDEVASYQDDSAQEMRARIQRADRAMVQVGTAFRNQSRRWNARQRARVNQIRNDLIQTRAALSTASQAFVNFRRATPLSH